MWTYCRCIVVVTLTFAFQGSLPDMCRAGITFLGPTPYLSAADSPFPVDGSNSDFYLEDFEDGELNTPGIRQRNLLPQFGDLALAIVLPPSPVTDSVDADDDTVDGLGRNGHSLASGLALTVPLIPPIQSFRIAFKFDELDLGFLPNAFGFAWTDGPAPASLSLTITTALGNEFRTDAIRKLGDDERDGSTSDDVFIGLIASDRIASVWINGGYRGEVFSGAFIEVDHIQYGLLVPEPGSVSLVSFFVGGLLLMPARRW